jgi:phosphoenolpyruvate---glycerone phosphotransferase subunit DhaL
MNGSEIMTAIDAAHAAVLEHKEEIASLDQAIGDGDHVFNLLRGLEAVRERRAEIAVQNVPDALKTVAKRILETVGGSAGPLLASLVLGMSKSAGDSDLDLRDFARMFTSGVDAMRARGKAGLGEKTMLDVLIPVAETLTRQAEQLENDTDLNREHALAQTLETVKNTAENAMRGTKDMIATKGRASFLGERARGVIDPGARSSQVMIAAICDMVMQHLRAGAL